MRTPVVRTSPLGIGSDARAPSRLPRRLERAEIPSPDGWMGRTSEFFRRHPIAGAGALAGLSLTGSLLQLAPAHAEQQLFSLEIPPASRAPKLNPVRDQGPVVFDGPF